MTKFRFESAPDLPGNERLSKGMLAVLRRAVHTLWDVDIEGAENVPVDGPGIIAPNHLSFCDSVFVPAALPRRAWAIGKGEYMDDWKTKHLFPAMGMVPVDRTGGKAAMEALDTAARILDGGHLFMIYPEGTRSRSGNLHKGRTGAARLAARCNSPIIPVGHQGTLEVQPPGDFMMRPFRKVTIRFGEPMRAEQFGDPEDPRVKRIFTDAVMFEIAALSGQTYVDTYAGEKSQARQESATRPLPPSPTTPTLPTKPTRPTRPTSATRPTKPGSNGADSAGAAIDLTRPEPTGSGARAD